MKNRKNLMVLILLALFMGVSSADDNNVTAKVSTKLQKELDESFKSFIETAQSINPKELERLAKEELEKADGNYSKLFDTSEIDNMEMDIVKALESRDKAFESKNKAFESKNKAIESKNKAIEAKNKAIEAKNKAKQMHRDITLAVAAQ